MPDLGAVLVLLRGLLFLLLLPPHAGALLHSDVDGFRWCGWFEEGLVA